MLNPASCRPQRYIRSKERVISIITDQVLKTRIKGFQAIDILLIKSGLGRFFSRGK